MDLVPILTSVEKAITDPQTGILKEISNLMNATDPEKSREAVFTLIGTVISLIISIIKAAVEQPARQVAGASAGQITGGSTGQESGSKP
jgi:uncharacterized membrane protein